MPLWHEMTDEQRMKEARKFKTRTYKKGTLRDGTTVEICIGWEFGMPHVAVLTHDQKTETDQAIEQETANSMKECDNARKAAIRNGEKLTTLLREKEIQREQEPADQHFESLFPPAFPSEEVKPAETDDSKSSLLTDLCEPTLSKKAVSKLLKGIWKYPELFLSLTLDQISSFKGALGNLLIEWGSTNQSDVPIEGFRWIQVYLVEQYLDFNQFDLSVAEKSHVHEELASMFTSVVSMRERIEVTRCAYHIIDECPISENAGSMNVTDTIVAGFIHLLLSVNLSETGGVEVSSLSNWPQSACLMLVNTFIAQPQKDKYNYRQTLSKLVNQKIWKPMEVVDLLLSIQTYIKSDDNSLPEAMEQLISSQSGFTLGTSRTSVIDILNEEGPRGLLRRLSINIGVDEDSEKDLETLCNEIESNKWVKTYVLERAKSVALSVLQKFQGIGCGRYSCPEDSHFRNHSAYEGILSNVEMLSDVLVHIGCAVKTCEGYWPRATQILSCILLSIAGKDKGRLIEIATGEGKSCIIAMYAVILALSGKDVDIVTSSPLLAERDCMEWKNFYELCGFSVGHNVNIDNDSKRQKCYEANIVYGTVGSFAADILRQEFHLRQTRGKRNVEQSAVIADEVDFMMLDRGIQFTYLSDKSPGLRHLEPIFATIWAIVSQMIPIQIEGEVCFADQPKPFHKAIETAIDPKSNVSIHQILEDAEKDGELEDFLKSIEEDISGDMLSMIDSDKMVELFEKAKPNLHQGLQVYRMQAGSVPEKVISAEDNSLKDDCPISVIILEKGRCLVIGKKEKYLQDGIADKIRETTCPQSRSDARINVPTYLQKFVEDRIPVWVKSAFLALQMTNDREYHIRDGQILPVDFGSTGVIQANKKWGDGLQQCLELKHHLQITEISLVTNYMSNLAFFKRYNIIYGVTGTLGSESDKKFLENQFSIDHCQVPTHKKRKHYEERGRILQNEPEWLSVITEEVRLEVNDVRWRNGGRAALVICEDINTAEKVRHQLQGKVSGQVHAYTGKGKGTDELPKSLSSGDVIVATNLAGRGTDIKVTDEVNRAGGLFVIVSFLPSNVRVEMQAFGRTSRKGQPGSAKLLVNYERLSPVYRQNAESVQSLKMVRKLLAKERMDNMMLPKVADCLAKEELFSEYCNRLEQETKILEDNMNKSDYELAVRSVHEKWGLWLQMKSEEMRGSSQSLKASLSTMVHDTVDSLYRKKSENIYHIICFGNNCMLNGKFEEAHHLYSEAVQQDATWASIAFYKRAYCTIKLREDKYKDLAISDLRNCLEGLKNYKEEILISLNSMQLFSSREAQREGTGVENDLLQYLEIRIQVLESFEKNIQEALGILESLQADEDAEVVSQSLMSLPHTGKKEERELRELWLHGITHVYSVKKKPRFCWSALAVFFIGIVQVAAGIFLTAVSCGALAFVGRALVEEGVSDIYGGIKGMINGHFDWKEWGIGKAMSLAISLVTFGVGSFIKRGMAVMRGTFQKGRDMLRETVGQVKAIPGLIRSQAGTGVMKSSMKTSFKAAGKEAVEQGIVDIANYAEDKTIEHLMAHFEKNILALIKDDIKQAAVAGSISKSIDFVTEKTLKGNPRGIDDKVVRSQIQNQFNYAGRHIIDECLASPEWQSYIEQLVIGVADKLNAKHAGNKTVLAFTTTVKAVRNVKGFLEASELTKRLRTEFESKLDSYLHEAFDDGSVPDSTLHDIATQSSEIKEKYDNLKSDIGNDIASILSASIRDIWHKNFVGKVTSDMRKRFNILISRKAEKVLGTDKTNKHLIAGVTALHAASMPTDVIRSGKPTGDSIYKHKQVLSECDEMASITDVRILSEKLGKKIIILNENENGKPLISVGTNRADDVITVAYQKPTGDRKYGHYNAVMNGKLIKVENKGNDCLFHAVSLARGVPNENVENDSRSLKKQAARELEEHPEKWAVLITRTNQARYISERLMMVGGLSRTDVSMMDRGKVMVYGKVGKRDNVEADHQPPCQALKSAFESNKKNRLIERLKKLSWQEDTKTVIKGRLPSVVTEKSEHRYVLSTGNSHESTAARKYIANAIEANDVERMLKGTILASSVGFSMSVDKLKPLNKRKQIPSGHGYTPQSVKDYKQQNIDILKEWRTNLQDPDNKCVNVMSDNQYKKLESWVLQEQYNSKYDPIRKEMFEVCKQAMR